MSEPLAHKPSIHRFHKALLSIGIEVAPLYGQLGINPETMASEKGSLSMNSYFSLLDLASRSNDIRFLSTCLAPAYKHEDIGVLVYLIRNARNFRHGLEVLRRYINLVSPGAEISLMEGAKDYVLTYGFPNTPPDKCYQDVEGTVIQFVLMIRDVLHDETWEPEHVYFAHPALNSDDSEKFPVGTSVVFNHPFSGVAFSKDFIEYPIEDADPNLLSILEAQVLQSTNDLLQQDSFLDRVRLLVSSGLGNTSVTSHDIAEALGMSRRTLYRRLQENGTSYQELREDIVFEMARTSLVNSAAPITHIALELGYSDASAFNRVFKRLSGDTPLQYRKKHNRV